MGKKNKSKRGRNNNNNKSHKKNKQKYKYKDKKTSFRNNKNWKNHFKDFNKKLEPYDLELIDIIGDGNCLFRSVSKLLFNNEEKHQYLRDIVVEHLKNNEDTYKFFIDEDDTFEEYIDYIEKDGSWGGQIEIQALSKCLEINFIIITYDENIIDMVNFNLMNHKTLFLGFHQILSDKDFLEHYSSIKSNGNNDIYFEKLMSDINENEYYNNTDERNKVWEESLKKFNLI